MMNRSEVFSSSIFDFVNYDSTCPELDDIFKTPENYENEMGRFATTSAEEIKDHLAKRVKTIVGRQNI